MAKTRSMTRNQNHDDDDASLSSSRKRLKILDNRGVAPWSDLNHDVLSIVMMQLGFLDFFAFSGVCKSWRSFALSSRNMFMASKPPMSTCTYDYADKQDSSYLEDFEGRRFRTFLPNSTGRICYGLTCGYLIFLDGRETHDFWLVNPVTKHELHFPGFPLKAGPCGVNIRAILVFSPSISGWMFVVLHRRNSIVGKPKLLFNISGKQGWKQVSSTLPILDLHAFKGKIYTLHTNFSVGELRLYSHRKRKWTLLVTKNFRKPNLLYHELVSSELVSSSESLYVINNHFLSNKVLELDIGEMKWVLPEKTIGEYAFFFSENKSSAAIKPMSWTGPQTRYKCYDKILQDMFYYNRMWYFPHDCLNVDLLDE